MYAEPADLDDLRARLRATRWPDAPEDAGWSLGTDIAYLRELVDHWAGWTPPEDRLPRFRTRVRDLGIVFLDARAERPAMPLILCHGWPDSSWRYEKVLPLLTDPGAHGADPADAFDVVVPDMPGFGHSDRPAGAPLNSIAVRTTLSLTDSEMPRKLIAAMTSRKTTAVRTTGMSTNALR